MYNTFKMKKYTLSKKERLKKKKEFKKVFDNQYVGYGKYMVLLYSPNDLSYSRVGVIASKKVSKRAVDRNRAKRLLKEVFRLNKDLIKKGDYILIGKKDILNINLKELQEDFFNILKGKKLVNEEK